MNTRIAHPNPKLLKWARTSINYSLEAASTKLNIELHNLLAFENGEIHPPFSLLRKMSEVYKRPLSVLYLPQIPRDFMPMKDYRRLTGDKRIPFSPELSILIRETTERLLAIKEIMEDEETEELDFVGSFAIADDEKTIANNIRTVLGINELATFSSRQEALNQWIEKVEDIGIFVFQTGNEVGKKINVNEARGFVISDKLAPFIFLNEDDAKAARIFTLVHELAHLWLNESGVSNIGFRNINFSEYDPLEVKCNKIAANVLLPSESTKEVMKQYVRYTKEFEQVVEYISAKFKVSKTMSARRAFDLGFINQDKYDNIVIKYQDEWEKYKAVKDSLEKKSGGPSYYRMKTIHNGKMFTKYVISLYNSQHITPSLASSLLNAKINNFTSLAKEVGM
jgi:Zn-dependent peptidase ImmA (M78 family)